MTKSRNNRRKVHTEEIKLFIITVALTATIGFWNYFSAQDSDTALAANEPVAVSEPLPAGTSLNVEPLPTLIPVPDNTVGFEPDLPALEQLTTEITTVLRSVTAPKPVVVQGQNPVIVQGRGGTSSSNSPRPVTTTRSSK